MTKVTTTTTNKFKEFDCFMMFFLKTHYTLEYINKCDFFHSVAWTLRSSPPGALIVWRVDRSNLFWIRYKVLICCFCYWDCT